MIQNEIILSLDTSEEIINYITNENFYISDCKYEKVNGKSKKLEGLYIRPRGKQEHPLDNIFYQAQKKMLKGLYSNERCDMGNHYTRANTYVFELLVDIANGKYNDNLKGCRKIESLDDFKAVLTTESECNYIRGFILKYLEFKQYNYICHDNLDYKVQRKIVDGKTEFEYTEWKFEYLNAPFVDDDNEESLLDRLDLGSVFQEPDDLFIIEGEDSLFNVILEDSSYVNLLNDNQREAILDCKWDNMTKGFKDYNKKEIRDKILELASSDDRFKVDNGIIQKKNRNELASIIFKIFTCSVDDEDRINKVRWNCNYDSYVGNTIADLLYSECNCNMKDLTIYIKGEEPKLSVWNEVVRVLVREYESITHEKLEYKDMLENEVSAIRFVENHIFNHKSIGWICQSKSNNIDICTRSELIEHFTKWDMYNSKLGISHSLLELGFKIDENNPCSIRRTIDGVEETHVIHRVTRCERVRRVTNADSLSSEQLSIIKTHLDSLFNGNIEIYGTSRRKLGEDINVYTIEEFKEYIIGLLYDGIEIKNKKIVSNEFLVDILKKLYDIKTTNKKINGKTIRVYFNVVDLYPNKIEVSYEYAESVCNKKASTLIKYKSKWKRLLQDHNLIVEGNQFYKVG